MDAAYLRVKRAREHVKALAAMQRRIAIDPDAIAVEPNSDAKEVVPDADGVIRGDLRRIFRTPRFIVPPAPSADPRWAIRFGEGVYNLRAALDYLVYSLAYLGSRKEQEGTQFPICDKPAAFQNLIHPRNPKNPLVGVNATHIAAIESLQPYPGRHGLDPLWLARLQEFSNPDKHRHLTVVETGTRTMTAWKIPGIFTDPMAVDFTATRYIGLGDEEKTPLVPALESLCSHVAETLDQFKPDFGP